MADDLDPALIDIVGAPHAAHVAALLERCAFGPGPIRCAVSGGPDSMALLVLARASGAEAHAVHVDHALRPESAAEAALVAAVAERVGATWETVPAPVPPGPNVEARARRARYDVVGDTAATGHTADDQAESLLLALLRGSAWDGLRGMEPGPRRPLLALRRAETGDLCARLGLTVAHDPSNLSPAHRRNRVRHELLPLMAHIADRDVVDVLVRQAELFRQGGAILDREAASLDPTDARAVAAAPEVLARSAIRVWLRTGTASEHPPDLATVDRVLAVARLEAEATDIGAGWRVRRSAQRLHLEPPTSQ